MTERVLVTGATGFIGARLAARLASSGRDVRCLVRDRGGSRARELERDGFDLREGDVLRPETLRGAGQGMDVAYYLIHSMGRGGSKDFAASERAAAAAFARMARAEGIERIIYLGGLGDRPQYQHLRSRHETALALGEDGPPLTYFRAGMVVGPRSESYRTLRYLVQRLPAMIAPAWLENATEPIAIDDTLSYLVEALTVEASAGRELQIGGPDVLTYGEMLDRMAEVLDIRRRPRIPVPLITPWLSSLWIGLVTPVDAGVARPLIEGLAVPTVVTDPSGMRCSTPSRSASTKRSDAPSHKTPNSRPHDSPRTPLRLASRPHRDHPLVAHSRRTGRFVRAALPRCAEERGILIPAGLLGIRARAGAGRALPVRRALRRDHRRAPRRRTETSRPGRDRANTCLACRQSPGHWLPAGARPGLTGPHDGTRDRQPQPARQRDAPEVVRERGGEPDGGAACARPYSQGDGSGGLLAGRGQRVRLDQRDAAAGHRRAGVRTADLDLPLAHLLGDSALQRADGGGLLAVLRVGDRRGRGHRQRPERGRLARARIRCGD
jgi:uncharacterized protein YbjT (DUF2867 family)